MFQCNTEITVRGCRELGGFYVSVVTLSLGLVSAHNSEGAVSTRIQLPCFLNPTLLLV